jgi:hypothetical protein
MISLFNWVKGFPKRKNFKLIKKKIKLIKKDPPKKKIFKFPL